MQRYPRADMRRPRITLLTVSCWRFCTGVMGRSGCSELVWRAGPAVWPLKTCRLG